MRQRLFRAHDIQHLDFIRSLPCVSAAITSRQRPRTFALVVIALGVEWLNGDRLTRNREAKAS